MNHYLLRIKECKQLSSDAWLYSFEPFSEKMVYKAGQFLTFLFTFNEQEVRRSYSLCSFSGTDEWPAIVVKRIHNGQVSRYITDHWEVGMIVKALPPAGRFTIQRDSIPRDYFFLAAGSGISPELGLIKQLLLEDNKCKVHLLYSSRNRATTLFYEELEVLLARYNQQFDIHYFFSDSKDLNKARLHRSIFEQLISTSREIFSEVPHYFLCGPALYMQSVEIILLGMGVSRNEIRKEIFVPFNDSLPVFELEDKRPKRVRLLIGSNHYEIQVPATLSILEAALQQHINIPYNCRAGKCSACIGTCLQGKVVMSYNEVLTPKDEEQGLVLTCTGHPLTNDVLLKIN